AGRSRHLRGAWAESDRKRMRRGAAIHVLSGASHVRSSKWSATQADCVVSLQSEDADCRVSHEMHVVELVLLRSHPNKHKSRGEPTNGRRILYREVAASPGKANTCA